MKRAIIFFLCLLIFCPVALAAEQTYHFDELNLDVTVPDGFVALTRDSTPNDASVLELGLTRDELSAQIGNLMLNRIYLSAVRLDPAAEITVSIWQNDYTKRIGNYSPAESGERESHAVEAIEQSEPDTEHGYGFTGFALYDAEKTAYIVYDIRGTSYGEPICGRQYETVYDGKCVAFTIIAPGVELSDADAGILRDMVDSLVFAEKNSKSPWASVVLALGLFILGGVSMSASHKRAKKLEAERAERQRQRFIQRRRAAYCPNCGAAMEGSTYCPKCKDFIKPDLSKRGTEGSHG